MRSVFGKDFLFGSATSAYQIEGATEADGRGPSIWDAFCKKTGNIADGSNGSPTCDHYHRYADDVQLMRELNLQAYRFSFAWPRIQANGTGPANARGLAFYDRLLDQLLANNITPFCTLYHWDLPLALGEKGGWLNRDTAYRFADYAQLLGQHFGDRIPHWATLNEPRCSAFVGHLEGRHAPGLTSLPATLQASHHLLLAHGLAIQALRAECQASLGIVLDVKPHQPQDEADQDAARWADGIFNHWFADPLFGRGYPAELVQGFGPAMPEYPEQDLHTIAQPLDSLGINYYTRAVCRTNHKLPFPHAEEIQPAGARYTAMGWEVYPPGLTDMLLRFHARYQLPHYYIAENGAAFADVPDARGQVHDPDRLHYLQQHLEAVAEAKQRGVPIDAYLAWSFMDNFEWGLGYTRRFGLVHVDYPSQRRTPKTSALWYRDFIASS